MVVLRADHHRLTRSIPPLRTDVVRTDVLPTEVLPTEVLGPGQ